MARGKIQAQLQQLLKAGIEDRKSALLTIVGALTNGDKAVLACEGGERKRKESWLKLLRDLKHRGLTFPPVTVADGHLGIWAAFGEMHPTGAEQRCWNHKITNVLNDRPKTVQRQAANRLKAMPTLRHRKNASAYVMPPCGRTTRRTRRLWRRCFGIGIG